MSKKTILLLALAVCLVLTSVAMAGLPKKATDPNPADEATGVNINADLSWTSDKKTDSHDVYFGTTSPGDFQVNQEDTTWEPGTMDENTPYYWRIDEKNTSGTTTGDVWSFTTEEAPSPPAAPSALGATAVSSSQINLGWTDNADNEDGFKIESKTTGAFEQIDTVGADVTTYNDTGLTASTTYTYRVRAYNGAGDSAYSNEAYDTTFEPSGGDCYVATDGNDADPGTLAEPFATIQHAVDTMSAGDTCYIRAGSYHEAVTIQTKEGTEANPITFTNYQDEVVKLDGTEAISGSWTQHSGDIYKISLATDVWQLFVDDELMIPARWPNATWVQNWEQDTYWGHCTSASTDGHLYDNPHGTVDLTDLNFSVAGGIAVLNVGNWKTWHKVVNSHTSGSNNFTYDATGSAKWSTDHHRYFLESKLDLLDAETEWFYDTSGDMLYLWAPGGGSPSGDIRGKTLSYAFDIDDCNYINITGLDFFATTFRINQSKRITIENSDLLYPSCSKRMLGSIADPCVTMLGSLGDPNISTHNTVRNCTFAYTDATGMYIYGADNTIENCLFHDIGYSSVNFRNNGFSIDAKDGYGGTTFRRNTLHTAGASEGYKAGVTLDSVGNLMEYNFLYNLGLVQSDGGMFQIGPAQQPDSITRYNWSYDSPKYGIRYDGLYELGGDRYGTDGLNHHNVCYDTKQLLIKGDYHETYNNTAYKNKRGDIIIRTNGDGNENSITRNNCGGTITGWQDGSGDLSDVPGTKSNNWEGDLATQMIDPDNFDFRLKAGSDLIDAGYVISGVTDGYNGEAPDIGAYESGESNYWIPGYQAAKASVPIPPDGTQLLEPEDLMWLGGYQADSHDVYFGTDFNDVNNATDPGTLPGRGNQATNIYDPGALDANDAHYWRIDTVKGQNTIKGDVWSFGGAGEGGTWEFNPADDTFVNSGLPGDNYGGQATMRVTVNQRYSYVKFVVTNTAGTVTSATLELKSDIEPFDDTSVYVVTGDWDESTLTWNDDDLEWGSLLDTIAPISALTWYEFNVTNAITGNGTYTLGLKTTMDGGTNKWYTKESASTPVLTVTTGPPDIDPPAKPTGLVATAGDTQVSLDWDDNTEEDLAGYNVYHTDDLEAGFVKDNTSLVTDSNYVDTSLTNDTQYWFVVTAVDNSDNESADSNTATATPYEPNWVQLTYDDFEGGWGNYTSGGVGAKLYTGGTYAHQGDNAADIEDDNGEVSSFYHTDGIDVDTAGYTQIKVEFWFKAISMDTPDEDFWVQYYDGTEWHTVAIYAYETDFENDVFYPKAVYINEGTGEGEYTFPDDMKIRFMCDASGGADDVYIDEIKVSAAE